MGRDSDFNYDIIKHIGILSVSKGWQKEVNIISWNEDKPKLDIRSWNKEHTKMGKGISLTKEEYEILMRDCKDIDF